MQCLVLSYSAAVGRIEQTRNKSLMTPGLACAGAANKQGTGGHDNTQHAERTATTQANSRAAPPRAGHPLHCKVQPSSLQTVHLSGMPLPQPAARPPHASQSALSTRAHIPDPQLLEIPTWGRPLWHSAGSFCGAVGLADYLCGSSSCVHS